MRTEYPFHRYALTGLCLVLLTSCSTASAPVTPTAIFATDFPEIPPAASLEINGQIQMAGIGSYCWSGGTGDEVCERIGAHIPTTRDPIIANTPFTTYFTLPADEPPESLF
jgi:hypothetical protein